MRATFRAFKAGITGAKGEVSVRAALAALDVPALHDVILRDRSGLTQIDHLVRTPDAILVLETKRYGGTITGEVNDRTWVQRFGDSPECFDLSNPLHQNHRHHTAVTDLIADNDVPVRSHVVSAGSAVFEGELRDVVVPLADLARIVHGDTSASQRGLDVAWHKLHDVAAQSPALRRAHQEQFGVQTS